MVSPTDPTTIDTPSTLSRGFITESVSSTPSHGSTHMGIAHFWGSVVSGALVAIAIGVMSYALMFACHVGAYRNGVVSFGVGAAIWIIITSCVAYFFGGMAAASFSPYPAANGRLRGATVWGLGVMFAMLLMGFLSACAGLAYAGTSRMAEQLVNSTGSATLYNGDVFVNFGGAWTVFFSLALGLVFAQLGGSSDPDMVPSLTTTNLGNR